MIDNNIIKNNKIFRIILLMLTIGFLFKINNTAYTEQATGPGGIWNVVTLILYCLVLIQLLRPRIVISSPPIKWVARFSVISTLFAIINTKSISISSIYNIIIIPYVAIIIILFYFIESNGISKKDLNFIYIPFWAISLLVGYYLVQHYVSDFSLYVVTDTYYSLCMLPLLMLIPNKTINKIGIFFTFAILILSGKRTGLVALVAAVSVFYIISIRCSDKPSQKNSHKIKIILGMLFFLVACYFIITSLEDYFNLNIIRRLEIAFAEGEGGRKIIHSYIYDGMASSSITEWIFGHGVKAVPILIGKKNALAHMDYLEILYDYGIISLLAYVIFLLSLFKLFLKMYRQRNQYAPAFAMSIVITLFLTTFSNFVIDATYITFIAMFWGIILAKNHKLQREGMCDQNIGRHK